MNSSNTITGLNMFAILFNTGYACKQFYPELGLWGVTSIEQGTHILSSHCLLLSACSLHSFLLIFITESDKYSYKKELASQSLNK